MAEAGGKHGMAFAQLLREMTSRSPEMRPSAEQCLIRARGGFLPEVFSTLTLNLTLTLALALKT